MDQKDREMVMREFRSGSSRVLVTTDLLGRGIDVQQVSLVINFEVPTKKESYIHRWVSNVYEVSWVGLKTEVNGKVKLIQIYKFMPVLLLLYLLDSFTVLVSLSPIEQHRFCTIISLTLQRVSSYFSFIPTKVCQILLLLTEF